MVSVSAEPRCVAPSSSQAGREKKTLGATKRDEAVRSRWREQMKQVGATKLVVDESGSNIGLTPLYGWAPKGSRVYSSMPRNRSIREVISGMIRKMIRGALFCSEL